VSTKAHTFYTVTCDGNHDKQVQFLDPTFSSAIEARAAAYAQGWRVPPKLLGDHSQSPMQVSDVCPECAGRLYPQYVVNPHSGRRASRS
jgi:hypothetical protein